MPRSKGSNAAGRRLRVSLVAAAALALTGLAAVGGAAGTAATGPPAPAAFRLADGSAGCAFSESGAIACRAQGGERALVLERDGDSRAADVPVAWTEETRVLLPGESWWHGEVACRARGGIVCATANGGTISVGTAGVGALAPAVEATFDQP